MMRFIAWPFLGLIRLYQYLISPLLGSNCRFTPTCSDYAKECFTKLPLHKAVLKTGVRICKCHPFHPGGFDPVEKKRGHHNDGPLR